MATVQLKRNNTLNGSVAASPASLEVGELAINYKTGYESLFARNDAGTIIALNDWINIRNKPASLPASDVYAWAKASVKPSYSWTEIGSKPTTLSAFTNDLGNYGNWITSSGSISGNAATATKLSTARTIWGQSFDGTANITGAGTINNTLLLNQGYNTITRSTQPVGSIALASYNNLGYIPSIVCKSDNNSALYFVGMTADNNISGANADVIFGVRRNDDADFSASYLTGRTAFTFRRYTTKLMDIERNADVKIYGNLTVVGEISAYGSGTTGLDTAPTSMTATGTTGERRFCSDGIYVCITTNTWRKSTYTTF